MQTITLAGTDIRAKLLTTLNPTLANVVVGVAPVPTYDPVWAFRASR